MAWGDTPADPAQLREMRKAGFNISGFCSTSVLSAVAAAGLVCFVDDPRANAYRWTALPAEAEIRTNLLSLSREIASQKAAFGVFLKDEPMVRQLPGLGKVVSLLREVMTNQLPYVNLFPYELSPRILGADYETYVRQLTDIVKQPFLSYDNYGLVGGEMLDYFYTNLEIIRRAAQQARVPFWSCILAVAHNNYMEPTDATLHLQVIARLRTAGAASNIFDISHVALGITG